MPPFTTRRHDVEIRQHEFAWLDISGQAPRAQAAAPSPVVARGAKVEKLAGGFFNISGGAVGPHGDFYFVDAHWQRIYRWDPVVAATLHRQRFSAGTRQPGRGPGGQLDGRFLRGQWRGLCPESKRHRHAAETRSRRQPVGKSLYLPVSDWHLNRDSLSHPAAHFISPDGTTVLPVGADFLNGATSWGVKSSPQIRSFGLGRAVPGKPFYVTDESELRTWAADVNPDGSLKNFRLFAEQGGEGVTVDSRGNVYIAAGQIYVYDPAGKLIDTIEVPERPVQLVFGGADHRTLFIRRPNVALLGAPALCGQVGRRPAPTSDVGVTCAAVSRQKPCHPPQPSPNVAQPAATQVAQTVCLLYRGLVIRRPTRLGRPADCQSAIQQVANLRYANALRRLNVAQKKQNFSR